MLLSISDLEKDDVANNIVSLFKSAGILFTILALYALV